MCNWTFFSFNWRKISSLHHPSGHNPLQAASPSFGGGGEDALLRGLAETPHPRPHPAPRFAGSPCHRVRPWLIWESPR